MIKPVLAKVLLLDAVSCGAIFVIGALATEPAARLLGLPETVVSLGGWICLAAGLLLAFLAVRPVRALLALAIAGNVAWVAASLAAWLIWFGQLTALGQAFVVAQAVAVAVFVALEMRAWGDVPAARRVPA
jgi:hypothetical protein